MNPFSPRFIILSLCLLMGMSVYAQTNVLYEKEAGEWTTSDIEDWPGDNATVTVNDDGNLYFSAVNTSYENKKSIEFTPNSIATLNITWNVGQSTGRAGGYNYIKFGGVEIRSYGQDIQGAIYLDGVEANRFTTTKDAVRDGEWTVLLTINQASGVCEYSIYPSTGNKVTGSSVTQVNPDGVAIGYHKPGGVNNLHQTIKSILVSETAQNVETASYTINYKTTDNVLLATETRTGIVGGGIFLSPTDRSDRWKDDVKYIYLSDDAEGKIIDENGSTVVTVLFREATKDDYILTAVDADGNELQQLSRGVLYEGETTVVYYRKGIHVNDAWYLTPQRTTDPYYGVKVTCGDDVTVTYSPSDLDEFIEFEDLTPSRPWAATGSAPGRYSNGLAPRLQKQSHVATHPLPSGVYTITLKGRNQSSSQTATLPLHLVDTNGNLVPTPCVTFPLWPEAQQAEMTVEGIEVPEGYALALYNGTEWNSNLELDYLTLKRTGDYDILLGDVNGDGQITITDATLIIDFCLTNVEPATFIKANADTTLDGDITVSDVTVVIQMVLGNN